MKSKSAGGVGGWEAGGLWSERRPRLPVNRRLTQLPPGVARRSTSNASPLLTQAIRWQLTAIAALRGIGRFHQQTEKRIPARKLKNHDFSSQEVTRSQSRLIYNEPQTHANLCSTPKTSHETQTQFNRRFPLRLVTYGFIHVYKIQLCICRTLLRIFWRSWNDMSFQSATWIFHGLFGSECVILLNVLKHKWSLASSQSVLAPVEFWHHDNENSPNSVRYIFHKMPILSPSKGAS